MLHKNIDAARTPEPAASEVPVVAGRWLMLVHQLPPQPSNLRVRTWRRLQALGVWEPLVRIAANEPWLAKAPMDIGAFGINFPMITSRADAEKAVRSVRYPPRGDRPEILNYDDTPCFSNRLRERAS